ncbi:MAG: recombinase family protein [Clostridiales bacterium]|nr:recombinase family protein [Clostridiales bacterium]
MSVIAIYPRKSKFTGKGESVQTQIDLCREYCNAHFENPSYLIYDEDEGYSGGNTNRPAFIKMMKDANDHKFEILCCYRLDRISRNVSDFSQTLDELHTLGIAFVSLKEQFDTSSPMGRAMIYIASVFAQLERDTITERITDNLKSLAKEGHWLGGTPPTGYQSKAISFSRNGKTRKYYTLTECANELSIIKILFSQYLEKNSYAGVETYCLKHCIQSRNGKNFSRATIKAILQNPVYCIADSDAWTYFSQGDFNLCAKQSDFDCAHGIQAFSRTTNHRPSSSFKPTSEWIIAVGKHHGAISGRDWVRVQSISKKQTSSAYQLPLSNVTLLSGVIKCGQCGGYMRPKTHSNTRLDGTRGVSYHCVLKASSRGTRCQMENIDARMVDSLVMSELSLLADRYQRISNQQHIDFSLISLQHDALKSQLIAARKELSSLQDKQSRLISHMSDQQLSGELISTITKEHQRLESSINDIRATIDRINTSLQTQANRLSIADFRAQLQSPFSAQFDCLSYADKRWFLQSIIKRVIWDGSHIHIEPVPKIH